MTDYYIVTQRGDRIEWSACTTHTFEEALKIAQQRAQTLGGSVFIQTFAEHAAAQSAIPDIPNLRGSIMGVQVGLDVHSP